MPPNLAEKPAIAYMCLLSAQLDHLYRELKAERRAIAQWEEDQDFSILGVVELYSSGIQGYVAQLETHHAVPGQETALTHLRRLNVFDLDDFNAWYFADLNEYPNVKQYIERIDYLRLLLLEHIGTQVVTSSRVQHLF
jgi:hypothetical protein